MICSKQTSRIRELETVIILAIVALFFGVVTHRQTLFYGAIVLLASALYIPSLTGGIARFWMNCARRIGAFNTMVILTIVYVLFLTPIAFLYRWFVKNPLMLKREDESATFYSDRNHTYDTTDFKKMW